MSDEKGFNEQDLCFLTEWIDSHLDDVRETIHQLSEYKSKIPEGDFMKVFDATLGYLNICANTLDKASMELLEANFIMFKGDKNA